MYTYIPGHGSIYKKRMEKKVQASGIVLSEENLAVMSLTRPAILYIFTLDKWEYVCLRPSSC